MDKPPLGRLSKVDLRAHWVREDTEFTPWLALPENVELLGEAIGIDLEVQQQEANVGPFRADILCRDTANDTLVLIENQLERTDHTHLGQLLTYAAGLDAVTLVWVVQRFTEEHRAALDWLNRITDESFHFFGLEIELWRIGESPPAPKFNLVAKPNDWSKTAREAASARSGATETGQIQIEFWRGFGAYLTDHGSSFRVPLPRPINWQAWGIGRSDFQLVAYANVRDGRVAVGLYLKGTEAEPHFQLLRAEKAAIETELGHTLDWEQSTKDRQLIVRRDADLRERTIWPGLFQWMLDRMHAFERTFRERVRGLNASDWQSGGAELASDPRT